MPAHNRPGHGLELDEHQEKGNKAPQGSHGLHSVGVIDRPASGHGTPPLKLIAKAEKILRP
jgi:hypothetical protein